MIDELVIRPISLADIPDCARWVAETPLWQRYGVTETSFRERLKDGLADGSTIYVAERAAQVVGFIWFVERGAFNRSGYVQLIGVRPTERSQGVGRALMQFAEKEMLAHTRDVFLLVSDFNVAARRFYQRLGYQQVGILPDYVVRGICELIFWKRR